MSAAKRSGTKLEPRLITTYGQEFISAGVSSNDPEIWKTTLAFLDYRSTENSVRAPATDNFTQLDKKKRYQWSATIPINPQKAEFEFTHGKAVPAEEAAMFEPIGRRLNTEETIGSEFILLSSSTGLPSRWKLDGYRLNGKNFASTVLASAPATTFHAGG